MSITSLTCPLYGILSPRLLYYVIQQLPVFVPSLTWRVWLTSSEFVCKIWGNKSMKIDFNCSKMLQGHSDLVFLQHWWDQWCWEDNSNGNLSWKKDWMIHWWWYPNLCISEKARNLYSDFQLLWTEWYTFSTSNCLGVLVIFNISPSSKGCWQINQNCKSTAIIFFGLPSSSVFFWHDANLSCY